MVNKAIDALPTVGLPLTGAEAAHFIQGGNSREINLSELADFAGRGGQAYGLGKARFSVPGDTLTAANTGSPTTNGYDGATGHWSIQHTGDQAISLAYQAVVAGDFDKVFALSASMFESGSSDSKWGVYYGDGTLSTAILIEDQDPFTILKNFYNTNRTTFGSTDATFAAPAGVPAMVPFGGIAYMRLRRVGTAITIFISNNGLDWWQVFTGTDTENGMATINEIGIWFESTGRLTTELNWLRLLGIDNGPQAEQRSGGGTFPVAFQGFRAVSNAVLAITASTDTVLTNLGTEQSDTDTAFDPGTGLFTVPASLDGKVMSFQGAVRMDASITGNLKIEQDDGGGFDVIAQEEITGEIGAIVATGPIALVAGHVFRLVAFSSTGVNVENDVRSFFGGFVLESSEDAFDTIRYEGTARNLVDADFKGNRTIFANNAAAITLTLDTGVNALGPLTIYQEGAGSVTIDGTATRIGKGSATNGQGSFITIMPHPTLADTYAIGGDLT